MKRLLLIGGGHAHLFVLENLTKRPLTGVETVLVTPHRLAPYSGMMPGVIAGHYSYADASVDLESLSARAECRLVLGRVGSLDVRDKRAHLADGRQIGYDVCAIDIGSSPPRISGVEHVVPVKPIESFLEVWSALDLTHPAGLRVAVIGGGAAGVELALAMDHRLRVKGARERASIDLFSAEEHLLPSMPPAARALLAAILGQRGIAVHLCARLTSAAAGSIRLADDWQLAADLVVLATGAAPADWPASAGLATDAAGFIAVDGSLRSISHADHYAAGDIASVVGQPRPKAGVWAVRAGPVLAENLRAAFGEGRHGAWQPQRQALAILGTGGRHAVAIWRGSVVQGGWVWRWKDHIDRRFVRRFNSGRGRDRP